MAHYHQIKPTTKATIASETPHATVQLNVQRTVRHETGEGSQQITDNHTTTLGVTLIYVMRRKRREQAKEPVYVSNCMEIRNRTGPARQHAWQPPPAPGTLLAALPSPVTDPRSPPTMHRLEYCRRSSGPVERKNKSHTRCVKGQYEGYATVCRPIDRCISSSKKNPW